MSVKRVITVSLLSQLLIEAIDEIEDNHKELFRHGFKQAAKVMVDQSGKLLQKVYIPLSDEQQVEFMQLTTEIQNELREMVNQINTDK